MMMSAAAWERRTTTARSVVGRDGRASRGTAAPTARVAELRRPRNVMQCEFIERVVI